jgi:DNA polymerase-3 subunit delta
MARRASAPAPDQVLEKTLTALRGGSWPPGLTVLTGDDLYHLDRAQKALLETLVAADESDFALTVFGEEKTDVATVVSAARSAGMFASRRVVLVRDFAALDGDADVLEAYAAQPPAASYLIIRAVELDQRRKLHKVLVACGKVLAFSSRGADPRRLVGTLETMGRERGLKLEKDAALFLAEVTGGDLQRAERELEKIRCYLGADGGRVSRDVAAELASGGELMSGWEVADAVLRRDRGAALAAVGRLVESGDEPIRIVGGVAWRARVMLQAKGMLERGIPSRQVIQATRAWSYDRALLDGLSRYSLGELLEFPAKLLEADRTLKSRSIKPRAVLEHLVENLT